MCAQETSLFVDHEVITLTREGVWLSNGEEITHQGMVDAFAAHLRQENGDWVIAIGHERKVIEVQDTPYFVTGLDGDGHSTPFGLRLNDGTREPLTLDSLRLDPSRGRLTCRVKGLCEARFLRPAYLELLQLAEESDGAYFLEALDGRTGLRTRIRLQDAPSASAK